MKVLHVTEELSKKNYSISSLIFFLSDHIVKNIPLKYDVLASDIQTEIFKSSKKIKIIKYKNIEDIFNQSILLEKTINNYEIVHIHGIWRAINLLTIYFCIKLNKTFYIHPHGMMLDGALRNKGLINFYIKFFFLKISNYLYGKNINFISITALESQSIKKFFPKSKSIFIPNPVPLNISVKKKYNLKKRFVFFGRIHPIKNIDLAIEGFLEAKLSNDWILEIYGIPDDDEYLKKIKKISSKSKNILIKEPVFGQKKQNILSSSWANILLSDSEVLSLSVLESASLRLPSLVNEDIQIDKFAKNDGVVTSLETKVIAKKIKQITQWDIKKRLNRGKKLKQFINDNYGIKNIFKKYIPIYENNKSSLKNDFIKKNIYIHNGIKIFFDSPFLHVGFSYVFNLMVPTLIMLALTFSGKQNLAADVAITSSIFITLTQIFSSNMRAQIISSNNIKLVKDALVFRSFFSLIILIISFYILGNQKFLVFENELIIYMVCFLILYQWIYEISLTSYEIRNKYGLFVLYNIINSLLCFLHILIIFNHYDYLVYSLLIHLVLMTFLFIFNIGRFLYDISISYVISSFFLNIKTLAFLSSGSIIISSLVWRVIIYNLFDKAVAAIYFACFSIGSFPGTTFNLAIGPTYVKKRIELTKNIRKFIISLFLLSVFVALYSTYEISNFIDQKLPNLNFIIYTLSFSFIGAFFMTYAMYKRQQTIQNRFEERSNIFLFDIIYGTLIAMLCPILYYIGGEYLTSLTFFLASILALTIYSLINKRYN